MTVWLNKNDLEDPHKLLNKLLDIHTKEMTYGMCFILTEDLTKKQLERIFK
jgi:hypothetical protein